MDDTFEKVKSTINSCETLEQLIVSQKFMFLYLKEFESIMEFYNRYDELVKIVRIKYDEIKKNDKG